MPAQSFAMATVEYNPVASQSEARSATHGKLARLALFIASAVLLYWPTLSQLPEVWSKNPDYSHGYAVPFIALALAIRTWRAHGFVILDRLSGQDGVAGMTRVICGLLIHMACQVAPALVLLDVLSMLFVISGMIMLFGGRQGYRPYVFALMFLIFMAPLPPAVYQALAIQLQSIACVASESSLNLLGVPVFRQGNYLQVPNYQMEVGAACSGLRSLATVLALSLLLGHLSGRSIAYRWTLVLLAAPVAVAANCLRVTVTALIMIWFGRKWADGVYHSLEGLLLIGLAALLLLLVAKALERYFSCDSKAALSC